MAKSKKPKEVDSSVVKEKKTTLFDMISYITDQKKPWDTLTTEEQKLFNPYMMNRFLSMDLFLVEAINDLQKYTVGIMSKKDVYNLYFHLLPQQKFYLKYIKTTTNIPEEDIKYISLYYQVGPSEAEEYYYILNKDDTGKEHLETLRKSYYYENRSK